MPRTFTIPAGTVFKTVSPPDAADIVVRGPIKLLTGSDPVTFRPLSAAGFRRWNGSGFEAGPDREAGQ
jgi:hypothetical protein